MTNAEIMARYARLSMIGAPRSINKVKAMVGDVLAYAPSRSRNHSAFENGAVIAVICCGNPQYGSDLYAIHYDTEGHAVGTSVHSASALSECEKVGKLKELPPLEADWFAK